MSCRVRQPGFLPSDQWPKGWNAKFKNPVVKLRLALYGQSPSGAFWERLCTNKFRSIGLSPVANWESTLVHKENHIILSVYVDDFRCPALGTTRRRLGRSPMMSLLWTTPRISASTLDAATRSSAQSPMTSSRRRRTCSACCCHHTRAPHMEVREETPAPIGAGVGSMRNRSSESGGPGDPMRHE